MGWQAARGARCALAACGLRESNFPRLLPSAPRPAPHPLPSMPLCSGLEIDVVVLPCCGPIFKNPTHPRPNPCSEFEIDFVVLSYCRSPDDIEVAREFLDSIGKTGVKVGSHNKLSIFCVRSLLYLCLFTACFKSSAAPGQLRMAGL